MFRHDAEALPDAGALIAALTELIGAAAVTNDRFGIAVSGGSDSLALLLLGHAALRGRIAAASVDHRLRDAARTECAAVSALCTTLSIPHTILRPDSVPRATQADARALRYALLEEWRERERLDWLMTGHHAEDQLETIVMRLNRSSGVSGLAGIRARNGRVLRPLLNRRRADLAAIVDAAGLSPADDPSNRDPRHDRARLRLAMAEPDWLDPIAAAQSAAHLAQAEDALAWMTEHLLTERVRSGDAGPILDPKGLPAEILLRMVVATLSEMAATPLRHGEVARLIARVQAGQAATLAGVAVDAVPRSGLWRFRRAAPHR